MIKIAFVGLLGAASALAVYADRTSSHTARPLSRAESQATRAGATIDITNPSERTINGTRFSQPLIIANVGYAGTDRLHLETWVNGTKTGYRLATYSAWGAGEFNYLQVPMPLVPPSTAEIELRIYNETQVQRWTTYGPQGGVGPDEKRTYTFSPDMKVAGINFWNISAGGMTAAFPADNVRKMIDKIEYSSSGETVDDILTGKTRADGSTNADIIPCTWNGWNLTRRATRTITLNNTDCLNPTVRTEGYTSWGPDPNCSDFETRVTNAMAAADANYRNYVNIVVVDGINVYDSAGRVYLQNFAGGYHPSAQHWSAVAPQLAELDAITIVHELGHEMGLGHRSASDPQCVNPILGDAPIMCRAAGRGADAAFCNAADRFTGISNLNPNR